MQPTPLTDKLKRDDMVSVSVGNASAPARVANIVLPARLPGGIHRGNVTIQGMGRKFIGGERSGSSEGKIVLRHNSGLSLLNQRSENWTAEGLTQFKLLGKNFSFTVDLSEVGCSCNFALYLISSPGLGPHGEFNPGQDRGVQPPYYCDANDVGNQWCPEVDIMEANNHVLSATLHKCTSPTKAGHYVDCDRKGCVGNTAEQGLSYGPGPGFAINTLKPFRVSTGFIELFGRLAGVVTTLAQEGREVAMHHENCDVEYLGSIGAAMADGMSMRMSYWGDQPETMAFLDGAVCTTGARCVGNTAQAGSIWDLDIVDGVKLGGGISPMNGFMRKDSVSDSVGAIAEAPTGHDFAIFSRLPTAVLAAASVASVLAVVGSLTLRRAYKATSDQAGPMIATDEL